MKSIKKYIVGVILTGLLLPQIGWAQEPNFSMYHYTPFFTNPASVGMVEDVRLLLNYRNQAVELGENFRTSSLSGFFPVAIGNHRLVLAGSFLNDQLSDFVTTNGGLLNVAYAINLSTRSALSLGLQGGFFRRDVEGDFTTDDQFVDGAFDPNAVSGDAVLNRSANYPTLSGGLYYTLKDGEGRPLAFLGGALYNALEPDISLTEQEDELPLSFRTTAGYRVYQGMKFSIMPTLRWVGQAGSNFANIGSRFGYELPNTANGTQQVELGVWYNTNELGVFSLAYERSNLLVAASFDLPLGDELSTGQGGIFELAVALRLKGKKDRLYAEKNRTNITQPLPPADQGQTSTERTDEPGEPGGRTEPSPGDEKKALERPTPGAREATETDERTKISPPVQKDGDDFGYPPLSPVERTELSRNVRFDFNTDLLDPPSQEFLDQVANILRNREQYQVKLIGHSCNLGPEAFNLELSRQRAQAVRNYLVQQGLMGKNFLIEARGEEQPLKDNDTPAGRQHNRRVEFKGAFLQD